MLRIRIVLLTIALGRLAFAAPIPPCFDGDEEIDVNNEEVIEWKAETREQFHERANVEGDVVKIYRSRSGHTHFSVRIGADRGDTIEVVYNDEFGRLPRVTIGMHAQACGDYITSRRPTSRYPASPDGALVHWLHRNPRRHGHEDGFLVLEGKVYGTGRSSRRSELLRNHDARALAR